MSRIKRSYENCDSYWNSQDHRQNQRTLFKGLQGRASIVLKIAKITKFTKTAKFTIIHKTTDKITKFVQRVAGRPVESYENCENYKIYENCDFCQLIHTTFSQGVARNFCPKFPKLRKLQNLRKPQILRNLGKLRYMREFASLSMKSTEIIQRIRWKSLMKIFQTLIFRSIPKRMDYI